LDLNFIVEAERAAERAENRVERWAGSRGARTHNAAECGNYKNR